MYEIRTDDGQAVFYQGDPDYVAYDIECLTAKGDAGYLKLTLPKTNPMWGKLVTRKTMLVMTLGKEEIGRFEVRDLSHDSQFGEDVYAVGELAWLYDSIQPQAEFHDISPRDFLRTLLDVHNAQCPEHAFRLGIVDVTDTNDSLYRFTNRETTLDDIRDKLVDRLGGNIKLRRVNGVRYLDYLTDATYGSEAAQRVYFGENLLDYCDNMTASDVCSAVIPLGCRLENDATNSRIGNLEQRLTVESVNGGRDYVTNDSLVARFGNVRTTRVWDDVTIPANLLDKAREWLASEQYEHMHLSVKAVDLSMTSEQFGRLRMGDSVRVVAKPYGLDRSFAITKRTYHPDNPASDSLELGDDVAVSYIEAQNKANKSAAGSIEETDYRQTQWLTEAIENVTAMMTGSRGGYKMTEYDDDGRWIADYYMDSDSKETAQVVHKVNLNGDAYSTNGVDGPYETAIMANGTILGKFIQAHSVKAEQISQEYTKMWEDADTQTLNTARSEFKAADDQITARVSRVETTANNVKTDLAAEVRIRADQISQTVKRGQINSAISQTAETIYIKSNKFGWESSNSSMTTDGTLTTNNMTATNINASGTLSSTSVSNRVEMNGGQSLYYVKVGSSWRLAGTMTSQGGSNPYMTLNVMNGSTLHSTLSIQKDVASLTVGLAGRQANIAVMSESSGRSIALNSDAIFVQGTQAYTGSIYLTYGNGGKIYLQVKNGLITGWTT